MSFTVRRFSKKRSWWKKIRRVLIPLLVVGVFLFLGGAISLAMLTAWVSRDLPNPNTLLERSVAQSTKIYDRTGEHILYDIHGDQARTMVKLADLPPYVKNATIAIEDKNFYSHHGMALPSIIRAGIFDILGTKIGGFILRRPGGAGGASTITQQVVKNVILSSEKTLARKFRELILAREIEKHFTKDQILQLYFNEIPYGRVNYGIEAASQSYFGKSAKDLSLPEAATLAALIQSPTAYLNNHDFLLGRRDMILDLMVDQGYISRNESTQAKTIPLVIRNRIENITAPHFVLWVKQLLAEKYSEQVVEEGGLKVITTLDYDKQKAAEEAITAGLPNIESKGGENAGLVAIDPKTGQILAMVGSVDYFADPLPKNCTPGLNCQLDPQVNITLRSRQPGSSFKPIVYAAGFIKGYTTTTVLFDVVTNFKTDTFDYTPHNYDGKERGPVTVRQALAGSLNIPAVKMIYLTGIGRVLDLADRLGYSTLRDRSRFGLSLVLGGGEVKLLEHVSAYATFANEGTHYAPVAILKVQDSQGRTLEEWTSHKGDQVIDPEITHQLTNILQDNNARAYVFGNQNHLTLPDRSVAAKTGTTNDFHDAWTVGYTPSLVAGVWVGNNDNHKMGRGADGSVVAAPIWQSFMSKALLGTAPESFTPPQPIVTGKPVLDGQVGGEIKVNIDRVSGLLATEFTPSNFIEQRSFYQAHSILQYVNKDDPHGPPPTDPQNDPQYVNWETAVTRWVNQQKNSIFASPPIAPDNLHTPENKPQLSIESPQPNTQIFGPTIVVKISVSAPRGINRVTYVVDGALFETLTTFPFDGGVTLPNNLPFGSHTLTITAYDDIDNSTTVNIPFTF